MRKIAAFIETVHRKEKAAAIMERIGADVRQFGPALTAAVIYMLAVNLIFHAFCPLVIFCGVPCPGCGMTRAAILVLTGRWAAAWRMNPVIFPVMAAAVYFGWNRYIIGRRAVGIKAIAVSLLILMIAVYGVRMYLYFPNRVPCIYTEDNMLAHIWEAYRQTAGRQ